MVNKDEIIKIVTKKLNLTPSEEQIAILLKLLNKESVIVNAVAGSGKTTITLMLGACLKELNTGERVLLLTYNRPLKDDNEQKIKEKRLGKVIEARTIHGLAQSVAIASHFDWANGERRPFNDTDLIKMLVFMKQFVFNQKIFDHVAYLVIDETQDLDDGMARFIFRVIRDLRRDLTLLVIGDKRQLINEFRGANHNYLTAFDKLYQEFIDAKKQFTKLSLRTSYRVPDNLCQILNEYFINEDWFDGVKAVSGSLTIINNYGITKTGTNYPEDEEALFSSIAHGIETRIQRDGANLDDFFILTFASEDSLSLANYLGNVKGGYVDHPDTDDENKHDTRDGLHKIVCSTVHSSKGRERKYVILPFFSMRYYLNGLKQADERQKLIDGILNLHYVALTRHKKDLLIGVDLTDKEIRTEIDDLHSKLGSFPYIKGKKLAKDERILISEVDASFIAKIKQDDIYTKASKINYEPTSSIESSKAVDYLKADYIKRLDNLINQLTIVRREHCFEMRPLNFKEGERYFIDYKTRITSLYFLLYALSRAKPDFFKNEIIRVQDKGRSYNDLPTAKKLEKIMYLLDDGLMTQVVDFNWLNDVSESEYDNVFHTFTQLNLDNIAYEVPITMTLVSGIPRDLRLRGIRIERIDNKALQVKNKQDLYLNGRIDMITEQEIIELKMTKTLEIGHKVQLAFYLFIQNLAAKALANCPGEKITTLDGLYRQHKKRNNWSSHILGGFSRYVETIGIEEKDWDDKYRDGIRKVKLSFTPKKSGLLVNYGTGEILELRNDEKILAEIMQVLIAARTDKITQISLEEIIKTGKENNAV